MAEQKHSEIVQFSSKRLNELFATGKATRVDSQGKEILVPHDLMRKELKAWETFLGRELGSFLKIPEPPKELIDVFGRIKALDITSFEPHYLIPMTFMRHDTYPGWKVKPDDTFWSMINAQEINLDSSLLYGRWILIDTIQKPSYVDTKQMYENDPLKYFLAKLRRERKMHQHKSFPEGSRFGLSWDTLHSDVFPELAKLLADSNNRVRLPRAIEFNIIGNMHHPEWGETSSLETFEDRYKQNECLCGGRTNWGGLANIYINSSDSWSGMRGFRPMLEF